MNMDFELWMLTLGFFGSIVSMALSIGVLVHNFTKGNDCDEEEITISEEKETR